MPARTRAPPRRADSVDARTPRFSDLTNTRLRVFAEHPDRTAALLFGLFVFAYLWPVLVGGKILAPISALYEFTPWQGRAPTDIADYYNFLLIDVPFADYPWRFYARRMIHEGTFPAWNPHVFAGAPFYNNPQNGLFSIFNLPLWTFSLNYGLGVSAALKLWAGGFGTYLLVRQLKLGFLPGLLAGVGFSFSSLNIVWLSHETLPAVAVMLPWMIWLIERIFERGRLGSAIGLAFATAIALGGGHPGMQLHVMAAAGVYVLIRAALARDAEAGQRLRLLALAGGGLVMGAMLMAAMLIPEVLSSRGTIGTLAREGGRGTLPGSSMPFESIKTVLFPDWWGRPSAIELPEETIPSMLGTNFNERTFYAGVVVLLLAFVGLLARDRWRRKAPFAALGFLALAITLHAPGLWWLMTHLPAFKLVQNQRIHFVFAFGVAVLAAFGLQALLERPAGEWRRLVVPLAAVLVGVIAFGAAGASGADVGHVITHFFTGKDYASAGVLALTSVSWFLLFALAVGAGLAAAHRWSQHAVAITAAIVLLAAFDALHFAHGYQPMGAASKMIPPETPAISYLKRHADDGRITGTRYALGGDWSLTYGLRDIRGYDPPQPTVRYFNLWRTANLSQTNWQPFDTTELGPQVVNLVGLLGARYILTDAGVEAPSRSNVALRSLHRVYAGKDATIFENDKAVPRVMVASKVVLTEDEDETRAMLLNGAFDLRRTAVVERGQPGATDLGSAEPLSGQIRITGEDVSRVTMRASLDARGLVVINDQLTEGWTVRVDGREQPIVRVNDVMRGVVVPQGKHEVELRYGVPGLRLGLMLSVLALGLLLSGLVATRTRTMDT